MKIILAILLFAVTFFLFVYIADMVVVKNDTTFDSSIQTYVNAHESGGTTTFMEAITFFGSHRFLIPAYLVLIVYYLFERRYRIAVNITAIGLTSTGVLFLLKEYFQRARPIDPLIRDVKGFSFPSGHSFSSFTFYGVVIYLIWSTGWKTAFKIFCSVLLFLFATGIAYSRIYLRVHFPSDIVAGFLLSAVWLSLAFMLFRIKKVKELQV